MTATDAARDIGPAPTFSDPRLGRLGDVDLELDRPGDRELDPLAVLGEIAEPIELADVVVMHRFRPGWGVRYSLALDAEDLKRWRKRSTLKAGTKREDFDEIRFAGIVMGNLARALVRKGEDGKPVDVTDADGEALTFSHPAVWQTYNASSVAGAVRAFYGNDPYLAATFEAILAEAGVGDEVETLDPTRPSSD